jgi:hypothetical protein
MDNLKHLQGKAVKSIEENNAGLNSYLIIKFTDDSKLNVSGYPHSDNGVAQLDIELDGVKIAELKNRKIYTIEEEFDGDMEKLIINFKKGGRMIIGAFNSKEDGTAGLETTVYVKNAKKLVGESLEENEYKTGENGDYIMNSPQYEEEEIENDEKEMKKFVKETLSEADWQRGNDDYDEYDELNMDDVENPDYSEFEKPTDLDAGDLPSIIDNELDVSEPDRATLDFRMKNSKEMVSGIPMAKMGDGSILFKTEDGLRKINLNDIVVESQKPKTWVSESLNDYE